jgi:hypothetical protein
MFSAPLFQNLCHRDGSLRSGNLCAFLLSIGAWPGPIVAAPIDFVRDVRPIFEAHCYDCHSGDTRKSGLRLDVKSAAMKQRNFLLDWLGL